MKMGLNEMRSVMYRWTTRMETKRTEVFSLRVHFNDRRNHGGNQDAVK